MASVSESKKRMLDAMADDLSAEEQAYMAGKLPAAGQTSWLSGLAYKWVKCDATVRMLNPEASGFTTAINKFCVDSGEACCVCDPIQMPRLALARCS
eukprot:SAG11_NODE_512_length_8839_cov_5.600572_13_plen_97_part_00